MSQLGTVSEAPPVNPAPQVNKKGSGQKGELSQYGNAAGDGRYEVTAEDSGARVVDSQTGEATVVKPGQAQSFGGGLDVSVDPDGGVQVDNGSDAVNLAPASKSADSAAQASAAPAAPAAESAVENAPAAAVAAADEPSPADHSRPRNTGMILEPPASSPHRGSCSCPACCGDVGELAFNQAEGANTAPAAMGAGSTDAAQDPAATEAQPILRVGQINDEGVEEVKIDVFSFRIAGEGDGTFAPDEFKLDEETALSQVRELSDTIDDFS